MLKTTPFNLFRTSTIKAFLKSESSTLICTGRSLGTWKLAYLLFQVNSGTRAIIIPTYRDNVCFYDQSTATGDSVDIDGILERAESEHTRLRQEGRLPNKPEPPLRKEIRFPVAEYQEITTPNQQHRYTFYEAVIPLPGTNTEPFKVVSWAKWNTDEHPDRDLLLRYGIGLPKDLFGQVAWLCCCDEKPTEYDKQRIVYEDGSAVLIIADDNILTFLKSSYTISKSQRYRFKYPDTEPTINP